MNASSTSSDSLFARFRRITTASAVYRPEVDGVRFIAIALVFLFHLAGDVLRHGEAGLRESLQGDVLFEVTQRGNFGVPVFFALSGFLLALPFARHYLRGAKPVSLRAYFMRRLTRLEPPYIICLIGFYLLKVAASRGNAGDLMGNFIASLLYVHNIVFSRPSDINFVAWSLEVEVQFYLLAPFVAWAVFGIANRGLRRGVLVALMGLASVPGIWMDSPRVSLSLLGQAPYFLAGFLLADFFEGDASGVSRFDARFRSWRWDLVGLVGVLGIVSLFVTALPYPWFGFWAAIDVTLALIGLLQGTYSCRLLSLPVISITGGMCYSLYLTHNYVIAAGGMVTQAWTAGMPFYLRLAVQSVVLGIPVMIVGSIFYLLIERPCMDPNWPAKLRARLMVSPEGAQS